MRRPGAPRRTIGTALLALALLAPGGCAVWGSEGGPTGPGGSAASDAASDVPATATVTGADGIQRVDVVTGDDLRLTPALVRAHPGTIEMRFHDTGLTPHSIAVLPLDSGPSGGAYPSAAAATGNLNGGQTQTIRLTIKTPGRYSYECVYHVASGMQGILEVQP